MNATFVPILAIGPGQVIALIVFTISVLSWFINLVQGNNPKGGPRPQNRPRPGNPAQSELEKFLQEVVSGGNPQPEKKRPAPPPKPARAGGGEKKGGKPRPQRPTTAERPGTRMSETHLANSELGGGVRNHVAAHLDPRNVDAAVQQNVGGAVRQDMDAAVQRHLGDNIGPAASQRPATVHPLIEVLRSPQGVRQAILMSEILKRPKAMQ